MRMNRLEGRNAVVVGVESGIGRACAARLAGEGASVLVVDADAAVCADVRDAIRGAGGVAEAEVAAFADPAGAAAVAARCEAMWSGLDIYVDCEAAMDTWPVEEDSIDKWESVIRVNALGPLIYTRALRPLLEESTSGAVVYTASIDGIFGNPNVPAYSMAKAGVISLTHLMAHALAPHGVRVNCIAPAAIHQTPPSDPPIRRPMASQDALMAATPLRRRATPDDIAGVAAFFASDDAAYITGAVLPVDGGRTALTPGTG